MSSPWDAGRDSNAGSDAFDTPHNLDPADVGSFEDSFAPPRHQLSEEDYRSGAQSASPGGARETPQRFTYPTAMPGGGMPTEV